LGGVLGGAELAAGGGVLGTSEAVAGGDGDGVAAGFPWAGAWFGSWLPGGEGS
jgi:hypothetical protein